MNRNTGRRRAWPNDVELGYYWNKIPGADQMAVAATEGDDPPPEEYRRHRKSRSKGGKRGRPRKEP